MSPPAGPPDTLKPSHEPYGEILPRADRLAEAARQFATALARQPNRARARADAHLPEFKEARDYLAHTTGR